MPRPPAHLAVLISGGGGTLLNLLDASRSGKLNTVIDLVIASSECPGAQRARDAGLNVQVIPGMIPQDKLAHLLHRSGIDWVVLAGYLKLVNIPPEYRGRVVNIHPALLPKFGGPGMYGHHVHEAVLNAGELISGCTVHLCDEVFDRGRIIHQKTCPVMPGDTPDTLAARVFEAECQAYPEALQRLFDSDTGRNNTLRV